MKKSHEHFFKDTWDEYVKKFPVFFKISLFFQIIPLLTGMAIIALAGFFLLVQTGLFQKQLATLTATSIITETLRGAFPFATLIAISLIISITALIIGAFFIFSNIAHIKIALSKEKEVNFEEALKFAKENFWNYLGLSIVLGILLTLLFMLLVIPGIIFLVYWILTPYIMLNEKKSISKSLRESQERIEGKWWAVFAHLLVISILISFAESVASIIPVFGRLFVSIVTVPVFLIFLKNAYIGLSKKESKEKKKSRKR